MNARAKHLGMAKVKAEPQERPWADDLDLMPLMQRKRMLLSEKASPSPQPLAPSAGPVHMSVKQVSLGAFQQWPGLPRGLKFVPSDGELLWHLLAKVGKGEAEPHPLISEFIISLDEDYRFGCTHPLKLPGVKQDGSASYFFHRAFKAFDTQNRKRRKLQKNGFGDVCWHKIGKTKPVILNGIHQGCKKIMVLYMKIDEKPEKTNWVMHRYHLGRVDEEEGDFVASKIFYHQESGESDKNEQDFHLETIVAVDTEAEAATGLTLVGPETHGESQRIEATKCHETSIEETHSDAAWEKLDKRDYHPKEELGMIEIEDQVLDSQQTREDILACGDLCLMDFSCVSKADGIRSCLFDNALTGTKASEQELESCQNLQDEVHRADAQFQIKVCSKDQASGSVTVKTEPHEEHFINRSLEHTAEKLQCSNTLPNSVSPTSHFELQDKDHHAGGRFQLKVCSKGHASQSVIERAEPDEVTFINKSLEHTVEKFQYSKTLPDAVSPTSHAEIKAEPLDDSCNNSFHEYSSAELQNISPSGNPRESSFPLADCLIKAELFQGSLLSVDRKFQEDVSTNFSLPEQASFTKDVYMHSNTPEHLSTTVLGSGGTHASLSKDVQFDCMDGHNISTDNWCKSPSNFLGFNALRTELKGEFHDELTADEIDHIPLKERLEMPVKWNSSTLSNGKIRKHTLITSQHDSCSGSIDSVNSKANRYSVRKKRKKTATDSVETALEEDAPGLLQVLLDKGITLEEIKLYGDMEDDEALEISPTDNNFEELENVINKIFFERSSLLKFSLGLQINSSKTDYCLACLISLIEQARYSQFRNSPVEWGWCRDLQSFIFIFEKHNRIVLERPEYGYATYFFELVELLPIDWQIKRLVTAMKLSSCSRTTLIENRSLVVGEDLTEGEARVLEEYGWMPNTGIGTMLNYSDRVVHDRRNEWDSSDWRAKIGKMLMAGHDGGRTVVTNPPKKVVEYMANDYPAIKLEV